VTPDKDVVLDVRIGGEPGDPKATVGARGGRGDGRGTMGAVYRAEVKIRKVSNFP